MKKYIILIIFLASISPVMANTVTINNPANLQNFKYGNFELNFSVSQTTPIDICSYYIDGVMTNVTGLGNYPGNSNTLGLYHFDNDALDYSGYGRDGTKSGLATYSTVTKKVGTHALSVSGNEHVNLTNSNIWSPVNLTIEMWIYPNAIGGVQWLYNVEDATKFMGLRLNGNTLQFYLYQASTTQLVDWVGIPANTWTHITATFEDQTKNMSLYINYSLRSSANGFTYGVPNITQNPHVGGGGNGFVINGFNGIIDELRISNITYFPARNSECRFYNTSITKNEADTFTINVTANDTSGFSTSQQITVTTDANYTLRVCIPYTGCIYDDNASATFSANGYSLTKYGSGNPANYYIRVNNSELTNIKNNSVSILINSSAYHRATIINRTITNETLGLSETIDLPEKYINITFLEEDYLNMLGNVSILLYNSVSSYNYINYNGSLLAQVNASGLWTILAQYGGASRFYYVYINPFNEQDNFTVYFPTSVTNVLFTVTDQSGNPVSGAIVNVSRSFSGVYYPVTMGLTQVDGSTTVGVKLYYPYKIRITKEGCNEVYDDFIFSTTTYNVELTCGSGISGSESWYLRYMSSVNYHCTNTTNSITCYVNDGLNITTFTQFVVKKQNYLSWDTVCDITNYTNPSNTSCSLGAVDNYTYWYYLIAQLPGEQVILINTFINFGEITVTYGTFGIFLAFAIIITLFFLGSWNPAVALVFADIGIIVSYFLHLLPLVPSAVASIVLVFGIIAYLVKT